MTVPWATSRRASEVEEEAGEEAQTPAEEERGRRSGPSAAPRSASAAPSFFGSAYSMGSSGTTGSDTLGVERMSVRDRGPSPAYTPEPEPQVSNRRSSLRNSVSAEPHLPLIPASDRSVSSSTERGRQTPMALESSPLAAHGAVIDSDAPPTAIPPSILEHGLHRNSTGEVRFAAATDPHLHLADTEAAPAPHTGRTASVRTTDSRISESSTPSLGDVDEFHSVAAGVRTALPSNVNSPAPSVPPSIHSNSSTETLSRRATNTSVPPTVEGLGRPSISRPNSMSSNGSSNAGPQSRHASHRNSSRPSSSSLSQLPEEDSAHEHKHKHKFGIHQALDAVKHKMSRSRSRPASRAASRTPSVMDSSASGSVTRQTSNESQHGASSNPMSRVGSSTGVAPAIPPHMLDREMRIPRHDLAGSDDCQPHGRSRDGSRSRSRTASPGRRMEHDRSPSRSRGRNSGMKVLTGALGLGESNEEEKDDDDMHNWKEFRKGVYQT